MTEGNTDPAGTLEPARAWLRSHPIPPSPGPLWSAWRVAARAAPKDLIRPLIKLLEEGGEGEQYGALLALRELGLDAWAEGYEDDVRYVLDQSPDEQLVVKPRLAASRHDPDPDSERQVSEVMWGLVRSREISLETHTRWEHALGALKQSSTLLRLQQASRVWHNVYVAAREEDALLEGVIDFLFEESGSLHLVELKTLPSSNEASQDLQDRLHQQLVTYSAAVFEVMKQRVADATIVFLSSTGIREVEIPLPAQPLGPGPEGAILKLAG
jgi:hypothetical protein